LGLFEKAAGVVFTPDFTQNYFFILFLFLMEGVTLRENTSEGDLWGFLIDGPLCIFLKNIYLFFFHSHGDA
jgi:hypothetical protein